MYLLAILLPPISLFYMKRTAEAIILLIMWLIGIMLSVVGSMIPILGLPFVGLGAGIWALSSTVAVFYVQHHFTTQNFERIAVAIERATERLAVRTVEDAPALPPEALEAADAILGGASTRAQAGPGAAESRIVFDTGLDDATQKTLLAVGTILIIGGVIVGGGYWAIQSEKMAVLEKVKEYELPPPDPRVTRIEPPVTPAPETPRSVPPVAEPAPEPRPVEVAKPRDISRKLFPLNGTGVILYSGLEYHVQFKNSNDVVGIHLRSGSFRVEGEQHCLRPMSSAYLIHKRGYDTVLYPCSNEVDIQWVRPDYGE